MRDAIETGLPRNCLKVISKQNGAEDLVEPPKLKQA